MEELEKTKSVITPGQTYICLSNEDNTKFEVDLITFREKGKQVKYLSVSFTDAKESCVSLSLDEESFETLKKFFKQLDWNG